MTVHREFCQRAGNATRSGRISCVTNVHILYIYLKVICFRNAQIYEEGAYVSGMRRYISEGAYVSVMYIASLYRKMKLYLKSAYSGGWY